MDVTAFVLSELPAAPARVLEVGCGAGELAFALSAAGHAVLAIDPEPPAGPIFRRSTIEDFDDPQAFDGVVASRSLHHVADLALALDRITSVLGPGGIVIIDDFGWERFDAASADRVGIPLAEWRAEHQHLHPSQVMLGELNRRFTRRSFSCEPYLHREERHAVTEAAERRLIENGALPPIGFRYVGSR